MSDVKLKDKTLSEASSSGPKSPASGHNPPRTRQRNHSYASSSGTNSDSKADNFGLEERPRIGSKRPTSQPPEQLADRPGHQSEMQQKPQTLDREYIGSGKLKDRVALITGADSGIGRAVAVAFAKEGADVAVMYLDEHEDAQETERLIKAEGRRCIIIAGDIGDESFCSEAAKAVVDNLGKIDVLVNNAGEQHPQEKFENISAKQLERTFRTNIFAMFYLTKAVMQQSKQLKAIINTASVTAYRGHPTLIDYASTKGAIIAFTRSLALNLAERNIRVNAVAPGPIWTPLIPSTFPEEKVETFGKDTPMGRAGQPAELAPAYVFLASEDSSYITGETIHINGGSHVTT